MKWTKENRPKMQFSLINLLHSVPHINGKRRWKFWSSFFLIRTMFKVQNMFFPAAHHRNLLSYSVSVSPVFSLHMVNNTFNPNNPVYVEVSKWVKILRSSTVNEILQTDKTFLSVAHWVHEFSNFRVQEVRGKKFLVSKKTPPMIFNF